MSLIYNIPFVDADTRFTQPSIPNTNFKWAAIGQAKHGLLSVDYQTNKHDRYGNQKIKVTTNLGEVLYTKSKNYDVNDIVNFKLWQQSDNAPRYYLYFNPFVTLGDGNSHTMSSTPGKCSAIRAEWKNNISYLNASRNIDGITYDTDNKYQYFNYDILNMSYEDNIEWGGSWGNAGGGFFYFELSALCNWMYSPRPGFIYHIYKIDTYNNKSSHNLGQNPNNGIWNTDGRIFKIYYKLLGTNDIKESILKTFILDNSVDSLVGTNNTRDLDAQWIVAFNQATGIPQPGFENSSYPYGTGIAPFTISSVRLDGKKALLELYDQFPNVMSSQRCRVDQNRLPNGDLGHAIRTLIELELIENELTNELTLDYNVLYKPIFVPDNERTTLGPTSYGVSVKANLNPRDPIDTCYVYGCALVSGSISVSGQTYTWYYGGNIITRYILSSTYGQTENTKDDVYVLYKEYQRPTVTGTYSNPGNEQNKYTVTVGICINNNTDIPIEVITNTNHTYDSVDGDTGEYCTARAVYQRDRERATPYNLCSSVSGNDYVNKHLIKISNTVFCIATCAYTDQGTTVDPNASVEYKVYKYDGTLLETKIVLSSEMEHYCKYDFIVRDYGYEDYTDFIAGYFGEFSPSVASSIYYIGTKKWFGSWNPLSINGQLDGIGKWSGLQDTPVNWV